MKPDHDRPALILDRQRALRNIERMAAKAERLGVRLRPHFKTHQSAEIGEWFRDRGTRAITVSSVTMAAYFAEHGWRDITIAIPVNLRELPAIDRLARSIDLGLLVDTPFSAEALGQGIHGSVRVWIKIDVGNGRAGVRWDGPAEVLALARTIERFPRLRFEGLLTHSGHSYRANGREAILRIHRESIARMTALRDMLKAAGIECREISIGDTPTCSLAEDFAGVSEIRPGNFVFFDLMQLRLGVCMPEDLAVAVACPVLSKYPARGQILLYGGAVHLSNESLVLGESERMFGCLGRADPAGRMEPGVSLGLPDFEKPIVSISQEHALARVPPAELERVNIGDLALVYPVHSCITCNLHAEYSDAEGGCITRL